MSSCQARPGTLKFEEMGAEVKEKLEKTNVDFGKACKVGSKVFAAAEVVEPRSTRMKAAIQAMEAVLENCAKALQTTSLFTYTTSNMVNTSVRKYIRFNIGSHRHLSPSMDMCVSCHPLQMGPPIQT